MQFNIISKPTQYDHIIVGSKLPPPLWFFHIFQTSGSTTSILISHKKHPLLSTVSGFFFLILLPNQLTRERAKHASDVKEEEIGESEREKRGRTMPFVASSVISDAVAYKQILSMPTYIS